MGRVENSVGIFLIREDVAVLASTDALPSKDRVFRRNTSGTVVPDHSSQHPVVGSGDVVVFID